MGGPWDDFAPAPAPATAAPAPASGPWDDFAAAPAPATAPSYGDNLLEFGNTDAPRILNAPGNDMDRAAESMHRAWDAGDYPSVLSRGIGGAVNTLADVAMIPVKEGVSIADRLSNGFLDKNIVNPALGALGSGYQAVRKVFTGDDPYKNDNFDADVSMLAPAIPAVAGEVASGLGDQLSSAAKNAFLKSWKLKSSATSKAGPDVLQGQENLANTWDENNIPGNPAAAYKSTQSLVDDKMAQVQQVRDDYTAQNPDVTVDLGNEVDNLQNNFTPQKVDVLSEYTPEEVGTAVNKVKRVLANHGFGTFDENTGDFQGSSVQPADIGKAVAALNILKPFAQGTFDEPTTLKMAAARAMYYQLLSTGGDIIPEVNPINHDISKLINLHEAAGDAAARMNNHNFINLGDMAIGTAAALAHGNIPAAVAIPFLGLRKGLARGRGAGLLQKLGSAAQWSGDKLSGMYDKLDADEPLPPVGSDVSYGNTNPPETFWNKGPENPDADDPSLDLQPPETPVPPDMTLGSHGVGEPSVNDLDEAQGDIEPAVQPSNLLTEDEYGMKQAEDDGYKFNNSAAALEYAGQQARLNEKMLILGRTGEVPPVGKMTPQQLDGFNSLVTSMETQPQEFAKYEKYGLTGVHPDEVRMWLNESDTYKDLGKLK